MPSITVTHPIQEALIDYHEGQGDTLYHVLSRVYAAMDTGRSLCYSVTIEASFEEVNRLLDVCSEVEAVDEDQQDRLDNFALALVDAAYPDKEVDCPGCEGEGCEGCGCSGKTTATYFLLEGSYMAYNPITFQKEYVD